MNEIKYEICLYISSVKLGLNVFEKTNSIKSIFFKEFDCKTILNKKEINFQEAENIIEKSQAIAPYISSVDLWSLTI